MATSNEEGPNPRSIARRIEKCSPTYRPLIAAVECPTPAPPPAADDCLVIHCDVIRVIRDQLRIDAKDIPNSGFDLRI